MSATKCINMRVAPPGWKHDPEYVYIGRPGKGFGGPFGNPFTPVPFSKRGTTLEKYREYLLQRVKEDAVFAAQVESLRGKTLVCFCKPKPCHGDILIEFLENRREEKS